MISPIRRKMPSFRILSSKSFREFKTTSEEEHKHIVIKSLYRNHLKEVYTNPKEQITVVSVDFASIQSHLGLVVANQRPKASEEITKKDKEVFKLLRH